MRSLIIDLILATDMKNHFETVSRFRVRTDAQPLHGKPIHLYVVNFDAVVVGTYVLLYR